MILQQQLRCEIVSVVFPACNFPVLQVCAHFYLFESYLLSGPAIYYTGSKGRHRSVDSSRVTSVVGG